MSSANFRKAGARTRGLSVLLIALVAFALLHGGGEASLNPVAAAAERTAGSPALAGRGDVEVLRDEGEERLAEVIESATEGAPSSIPVEVWIDESGIVRRIRQVHSIPTRPGGPTLEMDMTIDLYDFGIQPDIALPPPDEVFDTTPLLRSRLGLS